MFLTKTLFLFILIAIFASSVYAAGESTTAVFSGTITTATSTMPGSTGTIATATDRKVLFSLPSPLPKKKDLPQPPNVPRKKDIEYRFLALIALPAVIGLLVLAWTRFRLPTFSRCPCWQCRLAIPHFCWAPGNATIHCCVLCRRCESHTVRRAGI
ncbi:hypothetical protein CEP51_001043 [Fusarium floridanum]|uniref:Uncharacterized protein n=1 Tax=Fusarium floridanum TaxID=1325733 RepID=A0A428SJ32_9HYPO|nr:hypothetical protein CEP51_001043 [Fusarium floridanum]